MRNDAEAKVTSTAVHTDDVYLPVTWVLWLGAFSTMPLLHTVRALDFTGSQRFRVLKGFCDRTISRGHENLGNPGVQELADKRKPLCRKKVRMVGDQSQP